MSAADVDCDPYAYDDDPFDTHKDDCDCGHWRSGHSGGKGACGREITVTDYDALPPPQYPPGEEDAPFGSPPINWPPVSEWPKKTVPCPCKGFRYPEQDPSDYDH